MSNADNANNVSEAVPVLPVLASDVAVMGEAAPPHGASGDGASDECAPSLPQLCPLFHFTFPLCIRSLNNWHGHQLFD